MNSLARASPEYLVFACSNLGEFHLSPQFFHSMKLPITEKEAVYKLGHRPLRSKGYPPSSSKNQRCIQANQKIKKRSYMKFLSARWNHKVDEPRMLRINYELRS